MTSTVRIAIEAMQLYPLALVVCWTPRYVVDVLSIAGVQVFSNTAAVAAVVQSFNILHGSLIAVIFFWKSSEARRSWDGVRRVGMSRLRGACTYCRGGGRRGATSQGEGTGVALPYLTDGDEARCTTSALHRDDIEDVHGAFAWPNVVGTPGPSPHSSASISSLDAGMIQRMHEALSQSQANVSNSESQNRSSFGVDQFDSHDNF
jgi:hypothetical protein